MIQRKQAALLFLSAVAAAGVLASCAADAAPWAAAGFQPQSSGSDEDWETVTDGTIILENSRVRLELDAQTTHFTVTERTGGAVYRSVPKDSLDAISAEVQGRLQSELSLLYYDSDSTAQYMFSGPDSVEAGQYTVKRNGDALRIYYVMGQSAATMLVPQVFDRDFFENAICANPDFSSGQIRRLKRYYTLYAREEPPEDYAAMLKQYPVLAERDLYILKEGVDSLGKMEINECMAAAAYTQEAYDRFLKEIGVEKTGLDEPGFEVPVEYTLEEDGFTARILTDKIVENSANYKLVQVDFLEYFASCGTETSGEFLVPDGSGAIIPFNSRKSGSYYQEFYGKDLALQTASKTQLAQNAALPVWGLSYPSGGAFGIVENGAEVAALNAKVYSAANPQNNAFVSFTLRAMDTTDIGAARNIPIYNLYSKHLLQGIPQIRYVLFAGETGYAEYAAYYRRYLQDKNILTPLEAGSPAPLMLDYLCLLKKPAAFLGVPYEENVRLSSLASIQSDVERLAAAGISRVELRLFGYEKSGLQYTVHDAFSLSPQVGGAAELTALADKLAQGKGHMYLDADFYTVYRDKAFDRYDLKKHTARYMNRSLIRRQDFDCVNGQYRSNGLARYLVSPAYYQTFAAAFGESVRTQLESGAAIGLSCGAAGTSLTGDYSQVQDMDRHMSLAALDETLQTLRKASFRLTADGGNQYILDDAQLLFNIAMGASAFDIEENEVPFYQMVVHGCAEYSGAPVNLAADADRHYLKALAYGANPYFVLMTAEDEQLSGTDFGVRFYSLSSGLQLQRAADGYQTAAAYLNAVRCAAMTGHRRLSAQVYQTTYDNGVSIVVNCGDDDFTWDGETVRKNSFRVWGLPSAEGV